MTEISAAPLNRLHFTMKGDDLSRTNLFESGDAFHILADADLTRGQFSLIHARLQRGVPPPEHVHSREDEAIYLLQGTMEITVEGQALIAGPGSFVMLPRWAQHSWQVVSDAAECLIFHWPVDSATSTLNQAVKCPADVVRKHESARANGLLFPSIDVMPRANGSTGKRRQPHWTDPRTSRAWNVLGRKFRLLADAEHTDGHVAVFEESIRRRFGAPTHVHSKEDEGVYVLDGVIEFEIDGETYDVVAGDFLWLPRGTAHSYEVKSAVARTLTVMTPGGIENFFRSLSRPWDAGPADPIAIDLLQMQAGLYGITIL